MRDAQELRRRGDGRLGRPLPGQEVAKEIGDQQQRHRALERLGPRLAQGVELVERVDWKELATGAGEDLGAGDDLEDLLHSAPGQLVTVMGGVADQLSVAIEQYKVASPGVDGETLDLPQPGVAGRGDPLLDLVQQPQNVPVQATGGADGIVAEAVDLVNVQALAIEPPGNRFSAAPTQIEGQGNHRYPQTQCSRAWSCPCRRVCW